MRVIGRGSANVLIDYGDPKWLWRCCIRWPDLLSLNNAYTIKNIHYIKERVEPLLDGLICPMELLDVDVDFIRPVLSTFISNLDEKVVKVIKIKNLIDKNTTNLIQDEHFLKYYCSGSFQSILLELKPKWLYYDTDYCRNCTHNALKGREAKYCYSLLLMNPSHLKTFFGDCNMYPDKFKAAMLEYLLNDSNVFKVLYDLQKKLAESTTSIKNLRSANDVEDDLLLLMTLRDVSCFIEWKSGENNLRVHIIDVDLKPKKKWTHWVKTENQLESSRKISHISNK
ncbi:ipk1p [Saccharomyces arboricola H-6]|uniref:Inositol-pentakisphosphate 2-kinase n=1 Tax=Saccharomyces arboricola (strain H-6 / AS 2.3317 / CBS 10644) TaxID=1160507 RepID=J8LJP7_SACAR|nr:ipk1p [Saccharomyces arboricola H-6]